MKLIRRNKREVIDLPFMVGETYTTKMATGWEFTIERIEVDPKTNQQRLLWGWYTDNPTLINCPISPDRLIPKTQETGKVLDLCICPHCSKDVIV